ncbi:MAG: hypothetical protein ACR2FU_01605, partial [Streptosporangiaceae bacterium]
PIPPSPWVFLLFAGFPSPLASPLVFPGRVAVLGCLVNAAGMLLWFSRIQADPAYLTHLLPAQLIGGAGVGLTIPSLLGAGSASLPPARFGTGSGILNMARQIGTVLGVAALVAILAPAAHGDPLAPFRHGVLLTAALFAGAGVVAAGLLAARSTQPALAPATVPAPATAPPGPGSASRT